jgi:hypothetical protein
MTNLKFFFSLSRNVALARWKSLIDFAQFNVRVEFSFFLEEIAAAETHVWVLGFVDTPHMFFQMGQLQRDLPLDKLNLLNFGSKFHTCTKAVDGQRGQMNGFSPVCRRMCSFSAVE